MTADAVALKVQAAPFNPRGRLYFVDWLRVVLTISVVLMHCLFTYKDANSGMWSGQPEAAEEPVLDAMFWFFCLGGYAFRMQLFFVLAGYFTRRSYQSKGPRRYLQDRTLRLLLPCIFYIMLVQPFLFWVSDSSASSVADGYEEEVQDYAEFYVDALGNELPVPPLHTKTLGEWYKTYFTEPGYFGVHGPVWFVYNLWWFTVGYTLLMLTVNSSGYQRVNCFFSRLTACGKRFVQQGCHALSSPFQRHTPQQQQQQQQADDKSIADPVILQIDSATPESSEVGSSVPAGKVSAAAAVVDPSHVTTPFPMYKVVRAGAIIIFSLWVAQFLVRVVLYYIAAAFPDNEDFAHYGVVIWYYLITFEPALLPQYIAGFTLGVLAQKHNGLLRLPSELGLWCVCSSALFYVASWAGLWTFTDLRNGEYWGDLPVNGPQLLYVLAHGFLEMAFGVVWGCGWLVVFRELFNAKPKRFGAVIIGAAYTVYLIHPIFVKLYGRMLEHVEFPTFLINSIILWYLTIPSSWLVAVVLKRIPFLGTHIL